MCYVRYVHYVVLVQWIFFNYKISSTFPLWSSDFCKPVSLNFFCLHFSYSFSSSVYLRSVPVCVPLYQDAPSCSCGLPVYMMLLICLACLSHSDLHFYNISCIASFVVSTLLRIRILNKVVTANV